MMERTVRREGAISCRAPAVGTKGFALIELAIAIVVVSLLLGAGLLALDSQLEARRISSSQQRIAAVKTALENFLARTGRLPCPARADLQPSNASYGVEAARVTGATPNCTATIAAGNGFKGVVPWITLGIPSNDVNDGWGRRITYHVSRLGVFDVSGNVLAHPYASGMRGGLTLHNNVPVAAGLPATGNQINACSTTAGDNGCNANAVVVLISHGKNGLGAWQENGTRMALPSAGSREEVNTDDNVSYLDVQFLDTGNAQHFDDTIAVFAPRDMLSPLVETRQIKTEGVVLEEGLAAINGGVLYYALNHTSGVAPLEYGVAPDTSAVHASIAPLIPSDSWGNPLRYAKGVNWISASTSGVAYTIMSNGPNGVDDGGGGDDLQWPVPAATLRNRIDASAFK